MCHDMDVQDHDALINRILPATTDIRGQPR
jgi:hypothetical protein